MTIARGSKAPLVILIWKDSLYHVKRKMGLYYMSGFRTETMYDYYIVMKSMFLVVKLSSQPTTGYANLTILLPWTTHKQHQNYSKTKRFFQNQNFHSHNFVFLS